MLGQDVWMGVHTVIITGVTIVDGAIIAASSIVIKGVRPYTVAGGVPAKKIKGRFDERERNWHQRMQNRPDNYFASLDGMLQKGQLHEWLGAKIELHVKKRYARI